jgi:hypothetical protein
MWHIVKCVDGGHEGYYEQYVEMYIGSLDVANHHCWQHNKIEPNKTNIHFIVVSDNEE